MKHPNLDDKVTPELVSGFLNPIAKENSNARVKHAHAHYSIEYFDAESARWISLYGIYSPDYKSDEDAIKAFKKFRSKHPDKKIRLSVYRWFETQEEITLEENDNWDL